LYEVTETLYEKDVPFELRARIVTATDTPQNVYQLETVRVKLIASRVGALLRSLTVELTIDADLFFLHRHVMDASTFWVKQRAQGLRFEFAEYPEMLAGYFDKCITKLHHAVFTVGNDGVSKLHFVQALRHPTVVVLKVTFTRASDEEVRRSATERYNNALMSQRAEDQRRAGLFAREQGMQPPFLARVLSM
jgi:hypothetical protein